MKIVRTYCTDFGISRNNALIIFDQSVCNHCSQTHTRVDYKEQGIRRCKVAACRTVERRRTGGAMLLHCCFSNLLASC